MGYAMHPFCWAISQRKFAHDAHEMYFADYLMSKSGFFLLRGNPRRIKGLEELYRTRIEEQLIRSTSTASASSDYAAEHHRLGLRK